MSKNVAIIMKRVYLGDGNFIFIPSHPELGTYDEETGLFTDRNGCEYASMANPELLMSEIDTAFGNMEDIKTIKETFGDNISVRDAIAEYNYICSRYVYYISMADNGSVFYIPISFEDMKDSINDSLRQIDEMGGMEAATQLMSQQMSQQENELEKENKALSDEFRSDLASIIMEMIDGVYSLEELKEIKEQLMLQQEDLESTIDSVEMQIEATEAGVSSTKLKGEDNVIPFPKALPEKKSSKKTKVSIKNYINLDELYKKVTRTLIAQDEPTRRVITEIARKEQNPNSKNRGLLITGPTGSGKTKMMQLISKYLDRPFYKVDSTQLTIPGYVGKDIEEVLWDLYLQCGKDKNKAEHAIIFFDEIDKKGSSKKDDVSGKGVLNLLLPFIEGATYDACADLKKSVDIVKIDTSNMIVILGGAFTDVYKDLKEETSIGFNADVSSNGKVRAAKVEDFVSKAKMPDEFMSRVSVVKLNDLDVEAIRRIILESDESAIRVQKQIFEELGVKLTLGDDYIDEIASRAVKRKTGARGLNTVVDESTWEAYADAYSHLGEIDEIILGRDTVADPKKYQKILKKEV